MYKAFLVALREYIENIRTKGFWFGIMIVPLLYSAMIVVPTLLEKNKAAQNYAVIDHSNWLNIAVQIEAEKADLARVLSKDDLKKEPQFIKDLAKSIQENPQYLPMAVHFFLDMEIDPVQVPTDVLDGWQAQKEQVMTWWAAPSKTALAGTSRSKYTLVDKGTDLITLNQMIADESIFAYFIIGKDPINNSSGFEYVSKNLTDTTLPDWFTRNVNAVVHSRRLAEKQIDPMTAAWVQAPLTFVPRKIGESGDVEEVNIEDKAKQWAPVAFVYLLWISVFTITQMLLSNTIEEKSNRLIEVLLSSISPMQLMAGKIMGIAATGLTIVGTWLTTIVAGAHILPKILDANPGFDIVSVVSEPTYVIGFLVYFTLGYLFYAAVLVSIGAVCNSIKEAQSMNSPVVVVLMLPLLLMMPVGRDPNGPLAQILSYIPPLTPFIMMNRAAGPPTTNEYIITTILMIVSVIFAFWASAKVFRIGILMTGKPPKISEILRWIRASNGESPKSKE